jgi:acyl dehydratase
MTAPTENAAESAADNYANNAAENEEPLIGEAGLALVGQEISRSAGTVVKKEFQRWAAAVGDRNPLYFDEDYARQQGYRDVIMPPLFLSYVTAGVIDLDQLRPDGIPLTSGSGVVPLPRCPRRMAAGDSITFFEPVYPGDEITAVRVLAGLEEKSGRSGRFALMRFSTTYRRDDGTVVAEIAGSTIARPAAT